MIDTQTQTIIYNSTIAYWKEYVKNSEFLSMMGGKETGHHIADVVDDRTTATLLLEPSFSAKFEYDKKGRKLRRSMGDIWIKSNGIYNPVNIKAGVVIAGSPNIVSLSKLLTCLLKLQIDSYYVLIVKFIEEQQFQPHVYFFDLLDYLDFTIFDWGPGQIMLQEKRFYESWTADKSPSLPMQNKIDQCVAIMHDAYERLLNNRKIRIDHLTEQVKQFQAANNLIINQKGLFFGG